METAARCVERAEMARATPILANRIVAFRRTCAASCETQAWPGRQDDVYAYRTAMDAGGNPDLSSWMRRANIHRTVR